MCAKKAPIRGKLSGDQTKAEPSEGGRVMRYSITSLPEQTRKYWQAIFWEESTDYNELLTVCQSYPYYWISPVHEPDNECAKRHWHVIVGAGNPFCPYRKRSVYSAIVNVKGATWSKELGKGIAYPVDRLKAAIAYLVHLNNPEKEQFENGVNEITTNRFDILDEIVVREPSFDCMAWDEQHKPSSFMGSLGIIASEGFLTPSEAVKLVQWYANHLDIFEEPDRASQVAHTSKPWEFVEVFE